jgi:hypothetical protein
MPLWTIDEFAMRKLQYVKKHLHGDGSTLSPDRRRDLANIMSDVLSTVQSDEEIVMMHEECRHGEGSNYSEKDWEEFLDSKRKSELDDPS